MSALKQEKFMKMELTEPNPEDRVSNPIDSILDPEPKPNRAAAASKPLKPRRFCCRSARAICFCLSRIASIFTIYMKRHEIILTG